MRKISAVKLLFWRSACWCVAGGLERDAQGQWLFGFVARQGGRNAFMAKAQAMLLGMELVWDRGYKDVIVEVDCQEVRDRAWRISIERVKRECNAPEDFLAMLGMRSPGVAFRFLDKPPWEIETLVMRDLVLAR